MSHLAASFDTSLFARIANGCHGAHPPSLRRALRSAERIDTVAGYWLLDLAFLRREDWGFRTV